MLIEFILLVLSIALILILLTVRRAAHGHGSLKEIDGFPPGPNLRFHLRNVFGLEFKLGLSIPLSKLKAWGEKHGNIFTVKLGDSGNVVVLHGYKLIKEAFTDTKFNGRFHLGLNASETAGAPSERGITHSAGRTWSQQRKFVLKNFRDLGVGKQSLESIIHEELAELVSFVKQTPGNPINLQGQLRLVVLNSLWHLIAGERHSSLNCSSLIRFERNLSLLAKETRRALLGDFMGRDWVDWLLAFTEKQSPETANNELKAFIRHELQQHKSTFEDDNLRDFMDLYIREINDTDDKDSSFHQNVGEENAVQTILDLLVDAIEPTSCALSSALFYISNSPVMRKKFQDEIDTVIGHFHPSSVNDRLKMPYTEAVILEALRLSSCASYPVGLPHSTTEDLTFHNFRIPKGTPIVGNLYDLHHDERTWKDSVAFRPERFLKANRLDLEKDHPPLCPFSIGRRSCPGESFARDLLFLFVTTLFQRFHAHTPNQFMPSNLTHLRPEVLCKFKVTFEDRLEFLDRAILDEHDK